MSYALFVETTRKALGMNLDPPTISFFKHAIERKQADLQSEIILDKIRAKWFVELDSKNRNYCTDMVAQADAHASVRRIEDHCLLASLKAEVGDMRVSAITIIYASLGFPTNSTPSHITYEPPPPYTQHKNGPAEQIFRTINTKARCLLLDSHLPQRDCRRWLRQALWG